MEKIPLQENTEKTEETARAETAEKVVSFLEKTKALLPLRLTKIFQRM
jgi:hypothetical protein